MCEPRHLQSDPGLAWEVVWLNLEKGGQDIQALLTLLSCLSPSVGPSSQFLNSPRTELILTSPPWSPAGAGWSEGCCSLLPTGAGTKHHSGSGGFHPPADEGRMLSIFEAGKIHPQTRACPCSWGCSPRSHPRNVG